MIPHSNKVGIGERFFIAIGMPIHNAIKNIPKDKIAILVGAEVNQMELDCIRYPIIKFIAITVLILCRHKASANMLVSLHGGPMV
jgi:hypothetical protein